MESERKARPVKQNMSKSAMVQREIDILKNKIEERKTLGNISYRFDSTRDRKEEIPGEGEEPLYFLQEKLAKKQALLKAALKKK